MLCVSEVACPTFLLNFYTCIGCCLHLCFFLGIIPRDPVVAFVGGFGFWGFRFSLYFFCLGCRVAMGYSVKSGLVKKLLACS